jgi:hypothetical protein
MSAARTYPLAERLERLDVPIIFFTGYTTHWQGERWERHPRCVKPCADVELRRLLIEAAQQARGRDGKA